MSSDKPKPRKSNPAVRPEPAWRVKKSDASPSIRYLRSELLAFYAPSDLPPFLEPTDHIAEVMLEASAPPLSSPGQHIQHALGEDVNARERPQKVPDWFTEADRKTLAEERARPEPERKPEPKPAEVKPAEAIKETKPLKVVVDKKAVIRNLPKELEGFTIALEVSGEVPATSIQEDLLTEQYSQIDREMDKKLKQEEEPEETLPEWALPTAVTPSAPLKPPEMPTAPASFPALPTPSLPEFDTRAPRFFVDLLQEQIKTRDPFAKLIFTSGVADAKGFICCIPYSLPLEKAWYYKDPQGRVQGPFSSIDMYNWNLVGYFSPSLQVAWRSNALFLSLADLPQAPLEFWGGDPSPAQALRAKW